MEHQHGQQFGKDGPTEFLDVKYEDSYLCGLVIDEQQTRYIFYSENLDIDQLEKVESGESKSQGDILVEKSTDTIPLTNSSGRFQLRPAETSDQGPMYIRPRSKVRGNQSRMSSQKKVLAQAIKDGIENKPVSSKEKESEDDLKKKIFNKENYVDCPHENCVMKIYIDHIEKHLHDHETNTLNVGKKKGKNCFLCVECGCKYNVFDNMSTHIFNHFNPKCSELSKRKINSKKVNYNEDNDDFSSSDEDYKPNIKSENSSDEDYKPNIKSESSSDEDYKSNIKSKSSSDEDTKPDIKSESIKHNQPVIKNKNLKANSVQCDDCGRMCKDTKDYDIHLKKHHTEMSCESCQRLFQGSLALKIHISLIHKTEKNKSICDVCGLLVLSSCLKYHMEIHTSTEVHYCNQCDYQSYRKRNVVKHCRSKHSNLKPVRCKICGKDFKHLNNHRRHMRDFHSNTAEDKPFICEICGKKFKHSNPLKRHQLLHSGEKPFGCTLCDYRTNQRTNITVHMKSHRK